MNAARLVSLASLERRACLVYPVPRAASELPAHLDSLDFLDVTATLASVD